MRTCKTEYVHMRKLRDFIEEKLCREFPSAPPRPVHLISFKQKIICLCVYLHQTVSAVSLPTHCVNFLLLRPHTCLCQWRLRLRRPAASGLLKQQDAGTQQAVQTERCGVLGFTRWVANAYGDSHWPHSPSAAGRGLRQDYLKLEAGCSRMKGLVYTGTKPVNPA